MSAHYRVYVGPYLRCTTKTKPRTETITACAAKECPDHKRKKALAASFKFCPKCGGKTTRMRVETEGETAEIQIVDEEGYCALGDGLQPFGGEYAEHADPSTVTLVAGESALDDDRRMHGRVYENGCGHVGECLPVTPESIKTEIAWMSDYFAAEIEQARKLFGRTNVEVRWGVLAEIG